jgi:aspartate 1-decarboxylase
VQKGDIVIILTYTDVKEENARLHHPKLVYVDAKNHITAMKGAVERILS